MLLHLRRANFNFSGSASSNADASGSDAKELLLGYTTRLMEIIDAEVELWRTDFGAPEGQVIWALWASSAQRLRAVMDFTKGDRPLHELRTELAQHASSPAEESLYTVVAGSVTALRSQPGYVADHGSAGLLTGMRSAATARITTVGVRNGAVLRPLWGTGSELHWWLNYRSLDALEAAGHPGPVQRTLESIEIGGRPIAVDSGMQRYQSTRLM
jgi:hypothetical protein